MSETLRNCKIGELFGEFYKHQMGYSLSDWFEALQNKKLRDIRDEDIAKLIRQDLITEYAVLEATNRILNNPMMGIYDGEVLNEIAQLSQTFWLRNNILKLKVRAIIFELETRKDELRDFNWQWESSWKDFWSNVETLKKKLSE